MEGKDLLYKLRMPSGEGLYPRRRLFPHIRTPHPLCWICGPAGAGKTSLVLTYLKGLRQRVFWYNVDPLDNDVANLFHYLRRGLERDYPHANALPALRSEYQTNIETFSLRFFEGFFSVIGGPAILVFDSCQDVGDEEDFYRVIGTVITHMPEMIKVILTSRRQPPPALLPLLYEGRMGIIDYKLLRLDLYETEGLLRLKSKGIPSELTGRIHSLTDGWAMGVILVLNSIDRSRRDLPTIEGERGIFEHLASGAFNSLSPIQRRLLLSVAHFRNFTVDMAEEISEIKETEGLLEYLEGSTVFIRRISSHPVTYQIHSLFRDFLINQLSRQQRRRLLWQTGRVLQARGKVEEAAEVYRLSSRWRELKRLILEGAETMIEEGRYRILSEWIQWLPARIRETDPDLLYYNAHCLPPTDPEKVLTEFERSYRLYKGRGDVHGMYRCLVGSMECILNNPSRGEVIDKWLEIWEQIKEEHPVVPVTLRDRLAPRLLMALIHRRPYYRDFQRWEAETERVLKESGNDRDRLYAAVALASVWLWRGEFEKASTLMDFYTLMIQQEKAPPLPRILLSMIQAWYLWSTGNPERCIEVGVRGLEISQHHGIRIWDYILRFHLICAYLILGRQEEAESLLKVFEKDLSILRPFDLFYYHYTSAWLYLQRNNLYAALLHAQGAHRLARRMGIYHCMIQAEYIMAVVLAENGDLSGAARHINRGRKLNRAFCSVVLQFLFLLLEAECAFKAGRESYGLRVLRRALSIGAKENLRNFSTWLPIDRTSVAVKALKEGIEKAYLRELIRQRLHMFDRPVFDVVDWPWQVRVYTLGGFGLQIDGRQAEVSRKVQKRPLDLLKVLISAGGQAREEWVVERLWGSEGIGDAHRAFLTTLHRLRKLLGCERYLLYQDGLLRIDHRYVWVDCITFLKMLESADALWQGGQKTEAIETASRAIDLYKGAFLPSEEVSSWTEAMRQDLRRNFIRWIIRIGEAYEQEEKMEEAVDLYRRASMLEPLDEEVYRRLILLYGRMGRRTEAYFAYRLYAETLREHLHLEPSRMVEEAYRAVMKDGE